MLRALARGEDAWRGFVDGYGPLILHILRRDYAFYDEYDEHSRLEVLHDIYLRVTRYAANLGGNATPASFKGYLRRIIRTVMCNRSRVLKRWRREISLDEVPESADVVYQPRAPNPLAWLEEQWRNSAVAPKLRAAIIAVSQRSREPERTRLILERKLLTEAPYPEIAQAVGMGVDAVRHVVHYYRPHVLEEMRKILGLAPAAETANPQGGETKE